MTAVPSLASLGSLAQRILSAHERALRELGVDIPAAVFVSPGAQVAWDGEQLTCNLTAVYQGKPGRPQSSAMHPRAALFAGEFAILLLRAVPGLTREGETPDEMLPSPEELTESGIQIATDAGALAVAAAQVHQEYTITSPGEDYAVGPVTPMGPEGNLAGSRIVVAVSLT